MTDLDALTLAAVAAPGDELARGVLADRCDELDEGEVAAALRGPAGEPIVRRTWEDAARLGRRPAFWLLKATALVALPLTDVTTPVRLPRPFTPVPPDRDERPRPRRVRPWVDPTDRDRMRWCATAPTPGAVRTGRLPVPPSSSPPPPAAAGGLFFRAMTAPVRIS